jgi:uncharacterized membrane protein YbhN (UPF0104 family)
VPKGTPVPWTRSLAIFMAGLALLPTPAKAGVAVRSLLLLDEGVPGHVSLAAYFVERLLDFVGLVMLASLLVGAEIAGNRWIPGLVIGATALVAIVAAAPVCRALRPRVARWPALARAIDWLLAFLHDATHMLGGWRLPVFLALGMAANALTGILVWLAAGGGAGLVDVGYALGVIGVSHLSGSITLLPGGIGGFEAAMMAALAAVGVAPASALVAVAIVRATTLWGPVMVGLPLLAQGMRRSGGRRAAAIP